MSIQHTKCPGCGATVFSQPAMSGSNRPESTIQCEYCGSQFRVSNPNYRPDPVVHTTINTYTTTYRNVPDSRPARSSGWSNASDREHKVARILGYIIGWLMSPFVLGLWIAAFMKVDDFPIMIPAMFTGIMLFFFFIASRSGRELRRRRGV
ncbi:hypothetical protein [Chitinophaga sp. RAB17]|uniref:hypothetical protein n=1 Tax=Chitinophaga sp. RAB17 TaxID=3233049 RepID=UPI003F9385AC